MGSLLLDIIFVAVGAAVGTIGGWFLRGNSVPRDVQRLPAPEPDPSKGVAQVETLMARLHQLTSSVAADIGEHSNRVQEINHQLVNGADVVSIVERLVTANEQMQKQLQAAEKRLQSQASEIESHVKEARTDPLTRLANRRAFDDEIRRCEEDQRRAGIPFCVMMVDVDHFKKFNDTYGHQTGDEVLKCVARVLRREFTGSAVTCRYGGEEFAVIFPGQSLDEIVADAELGRAAIGREVLEYEGMDLRVAASGGIAEIRAHEKGEQLVRRADDALYVSKANGRNCGYWHDGDESHPIQSFDAEAWRAGCLAAVSENKDASDENSRFGMSRDGRRIDKADRMFGLSDREALSRDLDRRLSEQQRRGTPVSLMLIKLDRLPELIDRFGAKASELALRAAAQIIKATKREMDHAAQFEGGLFGVLLPGAELYEASSASERIRVAIENCKVPVDGEQLQLTVSIGVTDTQLGDDSAAVFARASQAMETAARGGGNRMQTSPEVDSHWPLFVTGESSATLEFSDPARGPHFGN
ncbi:MAG: diguanylate cyclase [Pirellulaceae bacterium]